MKFVVDENVSFAVVEFLRHDGHEVIAISETVTTGLPDSPIFDLVKREQAILITRDNDFTNPIRFQSTDTQAIIYLRRGNLTSEQEVRIIKTFISTHELSDYAGKLVTLYLSGAKIR